MSETPIDRRDLRLALLVGGAALVLHLPALLNGFVNWDDDIFVVNNAAVRSPDGLWQIWSTLEMPAEFPNYPLTFTSFWLDYRMWGPDPTAFHAMNNLLHAANAGLILLLARVLGASPFVAWLTALLFAVHPMQVESVAWISERKNLLSAFFGLTAAVAFLRHRERGGRGWYALSLAAFVLALLSKTAVLTLSLSLLVYERLRAGRWDRSAVLSVAPMFAFGGLAALATASVEPHTVVLPWSLRPLAACASLLFYLGKLAVPLPLLPIYPRWEIGFGLPWLLAPIAVAALAFLVARFAPPRWQWGAAHFFLLLLPVVGLLPFGFLEYSFVADHHVYLASFGIFLIAAETIERWRQRDSSRLPRLLTIAIVSTFCGLTLKQLPVWHDSVSLWRHVTAGNPAAYAAFSNLGLALAANDDLDGARSALERAIALKPDYAQAFNNLAMVDFRERNFAAAEANVARAAALNPRNAEYVRNLALAQRAQGKASDAVTTLRKAATLRPRDALLHQQMGDAMVDAGDLPGAVAAYREALRISPDLLEARSQLGRVLLGLNDAKAAAVELETVVAAVPHRAEAHFNLAIALRDDGRVPDAVRHLEEALRLNPTFEPARRELGRLNE